MVHCWKGTDHYLDSYDENGDPICGFDAQGNVDPAYTHIPPDDPEPDCVDSTGVQQWHDASPFNIWTDNVASVIDYGPVFTANGGGDDAGTGLGNDPGDYDAAETVAVQEPLDFFGLLVGNDWNEGEVDHAILCVVDTVRHGTNYEDMHCDDNSDPGASVLSDTGDFLLAQMGL
jgi:hypothetical protein